MKAANSEIGIAAAGTSVARQSCRKSQVISTTSPSAMKSVETMAFMKTSVNAVASWIMVMSTPWGKRAVQSASAALTRLTTARAFASGVL